MQQRSYSGGMCAFPGFPCTAASKKLFYYRPGPNAESQLNFELQWIYLFYLHLHYRSTAST